MIAVQYGWDVDGWFNAIHQDEDDDVGKKSDKDDLNSDS